MPSDTFSVVVDTTTNADETISELERLDQAVRDDTRALAAMKRGLTNLRGGGIDATAAMEKLKDQIVLQKGFVANTQAAYIEAGGTFRTLSTTAKTAGKDLLDAGTEAAAGADEATKALEASQAAADMYAAALDRVTNKLTKTKADPTKLDVSAALDENSAAAARVVARLKLMKSAGVTTGSAVEKLTADLAKLRAEGAALNAVNKKVADGVRKVATSTKPATERTRKATRAFEGFSNAGGVLGGRVGSLFGQIDALGQVMQSSSLIAIVAASGFVLLAVAAVAATVAVTAYGIALANTKREQELAIEGAVALASVLKDNVGNVEITAAGMSDSIAQVSREFSLARDKTRELSASLFEMGLRGESLDSALRGAAVAQAAAGDKGAAAFKKALGPIKANAVAVENLADKFEDKLGKTAEKRALGLGVQFERLKDGLFDIFSAIDITEFLKAFKTVTDMFQLGSVESQALSSLFEDMFAPLGFGATQGVNIAVVAFRQFLIEALKLKIQFNLTRNAIIDTFERWNKLTLGEIITEIGLFVSSLQTELVLGVLDAAADAGEFLWEALKTAFDPQPAGELGSSIVDGITEGILASGAKLIKSVTDLAGNAVKAFKNAIKSSSPSKVFMAEGVNIGEGVTGGVKDTTPQVHRSMVEMATAPDAVRAAQAETTEATGAAAVSAAAVPAIPAATAPDLRVNAPTLSTVPDVAARAAAAVAPPSGLSPRDLRASGTAPGSDAAETDKPSGDIAVTVGDVTVVVPAGDDTSPEAIATRIRQALIDEMTALGVQLGAK